MTEQQGADWTPRPDPTLLTTQQLLRELGAVKEVVDTRLSAMDKATTLLAETLNQTPTAIQTAVTGVRDIYDERFASVKQQFTERDIRFDQTAAARDAALDAALAAAKEAVAEQANAAARATEKAEESFKTIIAGLRDIYDERFTSIQQQFSERDVRTDQAATASASALAAALQAAKEAVFEQAQAAAKAAEKTELSFTKQIDQIGLQISTVAKGFDDRIGELKERIDRGEGTMSGATGQRAETRLNAGAVLSAVLGAVALVTFFILYVAKK